MEVLKEDSHNRMLNDFGPLLMDPDSGEIKSIQPIGFTKAERVWFMAYRDHYLDTFEHAKHRAGGFSEDDTREYACQFANGVLADFEARFVTPSPQSDEEQDQQTINPDDLSIYAGMIKGHIFSIKIDTDGLVLIVVDYQSDHIVHMIGAETGERIRVKVENLPLYTTFIEVDGFALWQAIKSRVVDPREGIIRLYVKPASE